MRASATGRISRAD